MNNIVKFKKNDNFYRGKLILMSKKDKTKEKKKKKQISSKIISFFKKSYKTFLVLGFLCTSVISIIAVYQNIDSYFEDKFNNIDERFNAIDKRIDSCSTKDDIEEIEAEISEINTFLHGKDGVDRQLEDINKVLNIQPTSSEYNPNDAFDRASIEKNDTSKVSTPYKPNTTIGLDNDGNILKAQKYINEPIFLTYTENNQEIYFLGQYNKNYCWNGYCVTNVYNSNGILLSICESNFDDGKRLDYKSYYQDSGNWIYSHRKCIDENLKNNSDEEDEKNNIKETIKYKFIYNEVKNFTKTNARTTDIIYVDDFINSINPIMLSYYHGDTSDGKYNDDTGNAYLINYFEDGTVKTLYFGNFKNGKFDDFTGNAWYIVKDTDTDYMYYKGHFENGITKNNEGCTIGHPPLSKKDIENYLKENNCNLELNWQL